MFDELKRAVFSCRRVSFSYFAGEGGGTVRTVEPVKLIFKSKDWYLYGFCLLRNDYRFFKLTRIKDLTLLPETFLRRKADVPELKPTIQQERLISVRLKFSPAAAFRVYDEFTDTVEKDAQGSLYVTVDMPERMLYSYILSYGDAVEILEPDELRRSMKEKLTRMAENIKHDRGCHAFCGILKSARRRFYEIRMEKAGKAALRCKNNPGLGDGSDTKLHHDKR